MRQTTACGGSEKWTPNGRTGCAKSRSRRSAPTARRALEILANRAEYLDGEWWLWDAKKLDYTEQGFPKGDLAGTAGVRGGHRDARTDGNAQRYRQQHEAVGVLFLPRHVSAPKAHPETSRETKAQRRYDLQSRLAMPCACLVVTLFGIPAGARAAAREFWGAF